MICSNCHGRGVLYEDVGYGIKTQPCGCQDRWTPTQAQQWFEEFKKELRGEYHGSNEAPQTAI